MTKQVKELDGIRRDGRWTRRRRIEVTATDRALTLDDGDVALTVPVEPVARLVDKAVER